MGCSGGSVYKINTKHIFFLLRNICIYCIYILKYVGSILWCFIINIWWSSFVLTAIYWISNINSDFHKAHKRYLYNWPKRRIFTAIFRGNCDIDPANHIMGISSTNCELRREQMWTFQHPNMNVPGTIFEAILSWAYVLRPFMWHRYFYFNNLEWPLMIPWMCIVEV